MIDTSFEQKTVMNTNMSTTIHSNTVYNRKLKLQETT